MAIRDWKERAQETWPAALYIGAGLATVAYHEWFIGSSDNPIYWFIGLILRLWLWPAYWVWQAQAWLIGLT